MPEFLMPRNEMMSSKRNISTAIFLVGIFICGSLTAGSSPRLNLITPRGVQRGEEHVLRFVGQRLSETMEVFLYDEGIKVLEIIQVDGDNVDVKVSVSADCRLGEHAAQIRTSRGISDFQTFWIGPFVEIAEVEPNNSPEQPQLVEWNRTINGVITGEDVDVFKMAAKQGQRLSVEIEAMRLGYFFDPFIAVVDGENFELAVSDDSFLHGQDGLLSLIIPADGDYFVLVRESSYGGDVNCRYRLHLGDFLRPLVASPAGGPGETDLEINLLGDGSGPVLQTLNIAATAGLLIEHESTLTPSLLPFRVSTLPSHFETEPNNDRQKIAEAHAVPCAFDGVIATAGDHDCFKFKATNGQGIDIECFARRVGSGLDPVINVFDSNGKAIVGDDDARRPDCHLRFAAPADGDYVVRVRDHLDRGQGDFVYRLELTPAVPALTASIPKVDRFSQFRQQVSVAQGNRFATLINASRANFAGELELLAEELPEGMTMEARPMVANLGLMPVVFSATEEAPIAGKLVTVSARHVTDTSINGSFELVGDFSRGEPNNTFYHQCRVDKLACAVTKQLPFSIELVQPSVPLVRDGSMNLKIVAKRGEGFDAPIDIEFPFRPPGLGTHPRIQMAQGQTEAFYEINANASAQLGSWPVFAIGQADVDGPAFASTQLAELRIAEPYLTVELNRTSCEQGQPASIYCKLTHRQAFEGEAMAEILGLPPNVEVAPQMFTKDTADLTFAVITNDQSPIGNHKGLFCRLTITENGEPIVSTAARSELQITAPAVAQPAASAQPAVAEAVEPVAQPKSRLQQLRDAARNRRSE